MKITLAVIAAILGGLLFMMFSGEKWSGFRWSEYLQQKACIPARIADGKGPVGNRLELKGEGETAPYVHTLTLWSCSDSRMVAIYEGLPAAGPAKLVSKDALRYRHGLMSDDDSRRFVTPGDLPGLRTIRDWNALVQARPL